MTRHRPTAPAARSPLCRRATLAGRGRVLAHRVCRDAYLPAHRGPGGHLARRQLCGGHLPRARRQHSPAVVSRAGATAPVEGISLQEQPQGTFAGPEIPFADLRSERHVFEHQRLFVLYDVERSSGPVSSSYTVDWKGEDLRGRIREGTEPHLRLHALTPCDEVALASGDPPQNKPANPRSLPLSDPEPVGRQPGKPVRQLLGAL